MHLELIAFLAGLISSTAAIPQIWTLIKTRDTKGISGFMFGMKNCSCTLWVVFGVVSGTYSIVLWNAISLALCSTVVIMKYRILKQNAKTSQPIEKSNIIPLHVAVDNSEEYELEDELYIEPQKPAIRLVYSRPREVQSILPLDMPETASSPSPQA